MPVLVPTLQTNVKRGRAVGKAMGAQAKLILKVLTDLQRQRMEDARLLVERPGSREATDALIRNAPVGGYIHVTQGASTVEKAMTQVARRSPGMKEFVQRILPNVGQSGGLSIPVGDESAMVYLRKMPYFKAGEKARTLIHEVSHQTGPMTKAKGAAKLGREVAMWLPQVGRGAAEAGGAFKAAVPRIATYVHEAKYGGAKNLLEAQKVAQELLMMARREPETVLKGLVKDPAQQAGYIRAASARVDAEMLAKAREAAKLVEKLGRVRLGPRSIGEVFRSGLHPTEELRALLTLWRKP